MIRAVLFCALVLATDGGLLAEAAAQDPRGVTPGTPPANSAPKDVAVSSAPNWDLNHDGIYTCAEWKQYVDRLFTLADRRRRGFIDAKEFGTIRKADPMFADADFDYFDDNKDGRLTRREFVDKPSPFFARYDRDGDCRVTPDELKGETGSTAQAPGGRRGR